MRWVGIALLSALLGAAPVFAGEPSPLAGILAQAEVTRAFDRLVLAPRRFALRSGPNLQDLAAIVVCNGERVEGALRFWIVFEQLEGEKTSFEYVIEDGRWTSLRAAVTPAESHDPTLEARVDLTQSPPQVTQRDAKGKREPLALPWKGDELGELFVLFVLGPLSDCGLERMTSARLVQEMSLLGPAERCIPVTRKISVSSESDRQTVVVREGEQVSARVRLGHGMYAGDIARLEFTDGLYADPITEAVYDKLHHALPVRMSPSPTHAATDALRTLQAAQRVYSERTQKAGSLAELVEAKLIDASMAAGRSRGWQIEVAVSEDGQRWVARASPVYRQQNACFMINESGELIVLVASGPLDAEAPFPADAKRIPRNSRW